MATLGTRPLYLFNRGRAREEVNKELVFPWMSHQWSSALFRQLHLLLPWGEELAGIFLQAFKHCIILFAVQRSHQHSVSLAVSCWFLQALHLTLSFSLGRGRMEPHLEQKAGSLLNPTSLGFSFTDMTINSSRKSYQRKISQLITL